jgi:hypothetical protein
MTSDKHAECIRRMKAHLKIVPVVPEKTGNGPMASIVKAANAHTKKEAKPSEAKPKWKALYKGNGMMF